LTVESPSASRVAIRRVQSRMVEKMISVAHSLVMSSACLFPVQV
jgi:hypothetical protein